MSEHEHASEPATAADMETQRAAPPGAGGLVGHTLRLQQTAGNAAVARLARAGRLGGASPRRRLARDAGGAGAGPVTFANADLQAIYDKYKPGNLSQQVALQLLDKTRTGPWSGIKWDAVAKGAAERVYSPQIMQQNPLGVCGPAAVVNYEASVDPTAYAQQIIDLFESGKLDEKKINSTLLGNSPPAGMDPSDWMLFSAMQDVTNSIYEYHGKFEDKREGISCGALEKNLKKFAGCVETTTNWTSAWGMVKEGKAAGDLITKHGSDVVVVLFISADVLQDETAEKDSPNHFVRLLQPMTFTKDTVEMYVFTWGGFKTFTFKLANYERMVEAFVIGSRKKGVL